MTYQFTDKQKKLHEKALKLLGDINECRSFFSFDPKYMEERLNEYKNEYGNVLRELTEEIINGSVELSESRESVAA